MHSPALNVRETVRGWAEITPFHQGAALALSLASPQIFSLLMDNMFHLLCLFCLSLHNCQHACFLVVSHTADSGSINQFVMQWDEKSCTVIVKKRSKHLLLNFSNYSSLCTLSSSTTFASFFMCLVQFCVELFSLFCSGICKECIVMGLASNNKKKIKNIYIYPEYR